MADIITEVTKACKTADKNMPEHIINDMIRQLTVIQEHGEGHFSFTFHNAKDAKKFMDTFTGSFPFKATASGATVTLTFIKTVAVVPTWEDPLEDKLGKAIMDGYKSADPETTVVGKNGKAVDAVQNMVEFFAGFVKDAKNGKVSWEVGGAYIENSIAVGDANTAKEITKRIVPILRRELPNMPIRIEGSDIVLGKKAPLKVELNIDN